MGREWISGTWGDVVSFRKQRRVSSGQLLTVATKGGGTRPADARPESRTPTHEVKPGEFVYLRQGAAAGVIAVSDHEGLVSVNFPVGVLSGRVLAAYVKLLLRSESVLTAFRAASSGTAQPFLSERGFVEVPVTYPPDLREQQRIINLLSSADASTESLEVELAAARNVRRQLLIDAVRNHEALPFSKTVKLGDVAESQLGKMLNTSRQTGKGVRPYLRAANITGWGTLDLSDLKSMDFDEVELDKFSVKTGDLLVTEGGDAGRCVVYVGEEALCFQNAIHRVRADTSKTSNEYLALVLEYLSATGQLDRYCATTTIKHLSSGSLKSVEMRLPTLAVQQSAVANIKAATTLAEAVSSRLQQAKHLRDQMLHDLLSGAHTIPESYDRFLAEVTS